MPSNLPRRSFLKHALVSSAAMGLTDLRFLSGLPSVSAAEMEPAPGFVSFRPEIEPLVRLLETTSRDRVLEEVAQRIRNGTTYPEMLAAVMLAGVRNIQPRPVGFKFHAVLVVHSAHLASRNSPDSDRWLPLFWAVDQFKSSQAQDVAQGDWTMSALDETALPAPDRARDAFIEAMDRWDESRADVATAALARSTGAHDVFDLFCRYGARDFRDIGHKAIYVTNSWRTLQTIGWRHAEPVLRSLAYALLLHEGSNPADRASERDLPGRENGNRLDEVPAGWKVGRRDPDATRELLALLRHGSWRDAGNEVVKLLNRGVDPTSLWDACFQSAAEILMRRPGIVPLHACTTTNALHYAFQHVHRDQTRLYLLLQCAAFLTFFRAGEDRDSDLTIGGFEPVKPGAAGADALNEIFTDLGTDRLLAARKTLSFLNEVEDPSAFLGYAQRLIYLKGTNSHDYKFSSAVLEDYHAVSPALRNRFLAASVYWLQDATRPDNQLVARTRAALGTVNP